MTINEIINAFDNNKDFDIFYSTFPSINYAAYKYGEYIRSSFDRFSQLEALVMDKDNCDNVDRLKALIVLAVKIIKEHDNNIDGNSSVSVFFYGEEDFRIIVSVDEYKVIYIFKKGDGTFLNLKRGDKTLYTTILDNGMVILQFEGNKITTNLPNNSFIHKRNKSFSNKSFTVKQTLSFPEMLDKHVLSTKIAADNVFHLVQEDGKFNIYKNGVLFEQDVALEIW